MRHGEAEGRSTEGDAARALTPRGIADCRRLAEHFKDDGVAWQAILSSNARRARESGELMAAAMEGTAPLEVREELNLAGAHTLLMALQGLPDQADAVLLVAHNPGVHALTSLLAGRGGGKAARKAARDFPPGALARLTCDVTAWVHLAPGAAMLRAFITPKELS